MDTFNLNQFFEKVGAYIVRRLDGVPEIFLYNRRYDPDAPLQIPGGGVRTGETPQQALEREIEEETGFGPLPVIRKIAVSETPWLFRTVKRHWYLVDGSALPETWVHTVTGEGADKDERYHYTWYKVADNPELAGGLGEFLNPESAPELFPHQEVA